MILLQKPSAKGKVPRQGGYQRMQVHHRREEKSKENPLNAKRKSSRLHREKDKEIKKSARRDRRCYIEQLAEDAQATAERNDMNTVYQITKILQDETGPNQDLPLKKIHKTAQH